MKKFIDRESEMESLQSEYQRAGSALVIMYGRRRVGKTTLISQFIKDKRALFFLASEESEVQNRLAFKDKAAEFIGSDLLWNAEVKNWDVIFRAITDTSFESKPVIVIDEFQYLGKSNPAFPSIFQRIWEELLKGRSVMVILCGSLISMMESQTLAYGSPLYGRRTAQIRLMQIPFRHYSEFFPHKSRRELVEMYEVSQNISNCFQRARIYILRFSTTCSTVPVICMTSHIFCFSRRFLRWAVTFPLSGQSQPEIASSQRLQLPWR